MTGIIELQFCWVCLLSIIYVVEILIEVDNEKLATENKFLGKLGKYYSSGNRNKDETTLGNLLLKDLYDEWEYNEQKKLQKVHVCLFLNYSISDV